MKSDEAKGDALQEGKKRGAEAQGEDGVNEEAKRQKVEDKTEEEEGEKSEEELRKELKELYLCEMPEDFFVFWRFCKERNQERPEEAILAATGLKLVGPFDVMAGKKAEKKGGCLVGCRRGFHFISFLVLLVLQRTTW